jgi:hypothetical protein
MLASCIALIFSYTSPRDVARLALMNHTFREAFGWDLVWKNMLPFNYSDILSLATNYRPLPSCIQRGTFIISCEDKFFFEM